MPYRLAPSTVGERRSRQLRQRLAEELVSTRLAAGISRREIARRLRVSPDRIARVEQGDVTAQTVDVIARLAAALGLQLGANLYPDGDEVRDRGHLALLARFRARLSPDL